MDMSGIFSKLERTDLTTLIGVIVTEQKYATDWGAGNFLDMINHQIAAAMKDPHIPDFSHVIYEITQGSPSFVFKPSIMLAIGGYILQEIDLHPTVEKVGRILQALGIGGALGSVIVSTIAEATVLHSPAGEGGGTQSVGGNPFAGEYT